MAASRQRHLGAYLVAVAAIFVLAAAWWNETGRVRVIPDPWPQRLCAGETTTVDAWVLAGPGVRLDGRHGDRLSHRTWSGGEVRDGPRSPLPGAVEPFRPVRARLRIEAPASPGPARILPAAVREGAWWYGTGGGPRVLDVGPAAGRFALESEIPSLSGPAGAPAPVRLVLRNLGCRPWVPQRGDAVGLRLRAEDGGELRGEARLSLPRVVAPGEEVVVEGVVHRPDEPGPVCVEVGPVLDEHGWGHTEMGTLPGSCGHRIGPPDLAVALVAVETGGRPVAGDPFALRVRLRNTGTARLLPELDALGVRVRSGQSWDDAGVRVPLDRAVAPGEVFAAELRVPLDPAWAERAVDLRPGVVREGIAWAVCTEGCDARTVTIVADPPRLAHRVEALHVRPWAVAGGRISLAVELANRGREGWDPAKGDALGVRVIDGAGHVTEHRLHLDRAVPPGASTWVAGAIPAPSRPGTVTVQVAPLREGRRWFAETAGTAAAASVRVAAVSPWLVAVALGLAWGAARGRWPRALAWGAALVAAEGTLVEAAGIRPWPGRLRVVVGVAALLVLVRWASGEGRRGRRVAAPVALLAGLVALADGVLLQLFGTVVGPEHVAAWHQLADVGASARAASLEVWGAVLPWTAVAVAELYGPAFVRRPAGRARLRGMGLAWAVGALVLLAPLATAATGAEARRIYDPRQLVARYGVVGAHAVGFVHRIAYGGRVPLPEGGRAAVAAALAGRHGRPGSAHGAARGKDVVVVQAEALAEWVLAAEVAGEPVTPTLRRWAREGVHVALVDQTADGNTSDAELLALASLYPLERGAAAFLRADTPHRTLAHVLAERGYRTISAHPFRGTFWNRRRTHPAYGFETSWFREAFEPGPTVGWGLSDRAFLSQLAERISAMEGRVFVYAITLGLHHPYETFPPHLADLRLPDDLAQTPLGNYLLAMRHFDRALADLEAHLRRAGRWDGTVVVVFGDHDPRLSPTPALARFAAAAEGPGGLPTVPCVIRGAGAARPAREVAGQVDLAPTVLDLLGIEPPPTMLGISIFRPRPVPLWSPRRGVATGVQTLRWQEGGTACLGPSGEPRPTSACEDLARWAAEERMRSRWILDHGAVEARRPPPP